MERGQPERTPSGASRVETVIAVFTAVAIAAHLALRFVVSPDAVLLGFSLAQAPLLLALVGGGLPLVAGLLVKASKGQFGSDLLAGLSILTSLLLREYLAGALVVLMLSGGAALEGYAVRSAASVLAALARRMLSVAHRNDGGALADVPLDAVRVGDRLAVLPHEICPVDGTVVEGHGVMDESYLTGEPYVISKVPGSAVLSGAINGE
jgi:cation transport ATPase